MARALALLIGLALAALFGLVLWWTRLRPPPTISIELHVKNESGAPIESFGWSIVNEEPGPRFGYSAYMHGSGDLEREHAGGVAIAPITFSRVDIEITSKGHGPKRFGPVVSRDLSHVIDITLPDLLAIEGVVVHAGRPIADANVELLYEHADVAEGVPSGLYYGSGNDRARTDSAGHFRIATDGGATPYRVSVCSGAFAHALVGPHQLGEPPITVELTDGATIEGTLHVAAGRDARGIPLEMNRAIPSLDGSDSIECGGQSTTTDEHGRFRFEHVAPGQWLIWQARASDATSGGRAQLPLTDDALPFIVDVRDGAHQDIEIDATQPLAHLTAQLTMNGKPWANAYACLCVDGPEAPTIDEVHADAEGRWTLRARRAGRYRLVVRGNYYEAEEPRCATGVVEITAQGVEWKHDFTYARSDRDQIDLVPDDLPHSH